MLQGIPTPLPTAGIPPDLERPFVHRGFVGVWPLGGIPDIMGFSADAGSGSARPHGRARPRRSRDQNGFNDGGGEHVV